MSSPKIQGVQSDTDNVDVITAPKALQIDKCKALIKAVWEFDHLSMFHTKVTDELVPGYSSIISDPIDLTTMSAKLKRYEEMKRETYRGIGATTPQAIPTVSTLAVLSEASAYYCDTDVINDLYLMIANALLLNPEGSPWHTHAKNLKRKLPILIEDVGLEVDDDEVAYVGKGDKKEGNDNLKSLIQAEKKGKEDIPSMLKGMQEDLLIPIEELRKKYQQHNNNNNNNNVRATCGTKRSRSESVSDSSSDMSDSDDDDSSSVDTSSYDDSDSSE